MARFPYPSPDDPEYLKFLDAVRQSRAGKLPNLFRMLGHNPSLGRAWLHLGSVVRFGTGLPNAIRELAVCQVAHVTGAEYELVHHEPIALEEGVPRSLLDALPNWESTHVTVEQRHVLEYVDAVLGGATVDESWLLDAFGFRGVVELTATIAYYLAIASFVRALAVDLDECSF